jgi:hypothetical protein
MGARANRREMKARKAALRRRLADERALARAQLADRRPARSSRRRRLLLLAVLLLLYALLRWCHCEKPIPPPAEPQPAAPAPSAPVVDAGAKAPTPTPKVRKKAPRRRVRTKRRIKTRIRPEYEGAAPAPEPWLAAFRLQVAARSPRLSRCFEGVDQPGAVRWTALLDPARGIVSDHAIEPILAGADLSGKLRTCLLGALSAPSYRIAAEDRPARPTRVSIVIEF